MGRALFLGLPLDRGWSFEFDPAEAVASRYLVYRDRMWVREGKARFLAIRADNSRVGVNLTVKRWQPRIPECCLIRGVESRFFRKWLQAGREEAITSCCCRTERQMRIRWRAKDARRPSKAAAGGAVSDSAERVVESDVELLLSNLRCHQ
jgi:hypothetical protein